LGVCLIHFSIPDHRCSPTASPVARLVRFEFQFDRFDDFRASL